MTEVYEGAGAPSSPTRNGDGESPLPAGVELVGRLGDYGAADLPTVGGKGANLGELVRAGLPVPGGFVVTTAAYRAEFTRAQISADLRTAIVDAYRELGEGPVAVRSSATAEDLPGAAFAGQQDTYLNVMGAEAVVDAVVRCWASLWTDRAVAYRARRGIDPTDVAIAVVVQSMVDADAAGVMFTANPVTGRRAETVIDAAAGLGESVVSGLVTPDHYVLDHDGRVRSHTPGGHETVIRADVGGGTREAAGVPDAGRADPVLSETDAARLAGLGTVVAAHFGRPQDIEWAIAKGRVFLLQARPMTALPPEPIRLNPFQRMIAPFFMEMFTERPYPLDVSSWMEHGIIKMLLRMAGSVGVRFPPVSQLVPEEDGVVVRLVPPVPRPSARTLLAPLTLVRRTRRFRPDDWAADTRFGDFARRIDRQVGRDLSALSWSDLRAMPRELFDAMGLITELRVDYLPASFAPALRLRLLLALLRRTSLAPDLMAGARTRTSDANEALEALAAVVRADPSLRAVFASHEASRLPAVLDGDPKFAPFQARLEAFLAEYGHRETVSPLLVSEPTWSDAPEVVLGLIRALVSERSAPNADATGAAVAELEAHPWLRGGRRRRHVLGLVESARTGMAFREDSHFYGTRVLPLLRAAFLQMGERLCAAGVLTEPGGVFHLRLEELEAIVAVGSPTADEAAGLRRAVATRAAKRDELAAVPLLSLATVFGDRTGAAGALATGMGASGGTAIGPVRVIDGPADFGKLHGGDVMVCPCTNPSWTPLFQRAAAVVVDAGGMGSHAAIVAREYGIPAVMGTMSGTEVLADGRQVRVDGNAGTVFADGVEGQTEDGADSGAGREPGGGPDPVPGGEAR